MTGLLGSPASAPAGPGATSPPAAVRASRPGWRDPRLWIGIAIVAACVVAGVRVLDAADRTVPVWAVKSDEGAGATLSTADLEVHRVHVEAPGDLAGYYRADGELPAPLLLGRAVGHGELLPRSAVSVGASSDVVQLPLAVDPAQVPPTVATGSVVDVYVVSTAATAATAATGATGATGATAGGERGGRDADAAQPALSGVTVVAVSGADDVFGSGQTQRQLTVAVPDKTAQEFFALLAGSSDPTVTVVLRPAG